MDVIRLIFGIIYNSEKINAVLFYKKLKNYFFEKKIAFVEEECIEKAELIVVIGGDGTLIRAGRIMNGLNVPVLAVNMGSLGFLTDVKDEEAFEMIENILKKDYITEKRYFLEAHINDSIYFALNDLVCAKGGLLSRMVKIRLFANEFYVNTYKADGIIISSPTGSTAYSLSAGGPILRPDLNAVIVTPIAPHTLSARPIVLRGDEKIKLEIVEEHNDMFITVDGQISHKVKKEDSIEIFLSDRTITLVKPKNRDYYSILREKLKWGEEYVKGIKN